MTTHESSNLIYSTAHLDLKSKEIRLVEILPADEATVISCRFHTQTLQKPAPYTALSYTWGDTNNMKQILLDGEVFKVRDNLWQFLHQIREQGRRDRFWIDAICINQENVEERNHQVALMKDIYSKAILVAVWLGPAAANSGLAIKRLKSIAQGKDVSADWTQYDGRALELLCNRDYWLRIWIVQEFVLAQELTLHCGSDSLSWHILAFPFVHHTELFDKSPAARVCDRELQESMAAVIIHQRIRKETEVTSPPLTELIQTHERMESTDVRDKVYGLLGLAKDIGLPEIHITADYSKSALEIYWDFVDDCREQHGRLCGMCAFFARSLHRTLELPRCTAPILKRGLYLVNWTEHNGVFLAEYF
ncbi:HET-domain-containing protein [Hyaloscypha variabilis F]|uniref:HET-domain-containing protein n=1 Tax=Hyaloscypha variabilis (strain UAMH 11265 / GT02V1 / F) TaxID=1149755 RepID=A0A2J6QZ39_HYAVF|nr:HET-domain-containing protein [Hyaloscypha variabilis F]